MSERRTDIVEETSGMHLASGKSAVLIAFPANTVQGSLFLSINEDEASDEASAIYLTPDECETLGAALFRQAAYLREKG